MYGCESWTIKKAECWRIDAAELWCWRRFLRVSWTAKRSNKSILKEINLEYSLEGLMLKAEAPKIWPSDVMSQFIGKDSDAGTDWGQEEKGAIKDEMVGRHHWPNGHESEHTPGNSKGQGSLAYCSSWDHKELDTTERLNNKNKMYYIVNLIIVPNISFLKLTKKSVQNRAKKKDLHISVVAVQSCLTLSVPHGL